MSRQIVLLLCLIALILQFSSCSYFKINTSQTDLIESIENVEKLYKRFILHSEDRVFEIKEIKIAEEVISGRLISNPENIFYTEGRKYNFTSSEIEIKYEVHLYSNNPITLQEGKLALPLLDIKLIKIIEPDTAKGITTFIGGTVGVLAMLAVVVAATKSSCPYVYVHDGEGYVFQGETFGGAVAANLARHDYMPLPAIKPHNGVYRVRLNNELKEHQFTDIAELIVVNHESDQKVLLDKNGEARLMEDLQPPSRALNQEGQNILPILLNEDNNSYQFDELQTSTHSAKLTFKKPNRASHANLVLKAQNTMWFDYLYGEAISKFGDYYETWAKRQSELSREDHLEEVIKGGFPLFIYKKEKGNWKLVDYLFTPGPLASREFVLPIDISNISDPELEIKIETGFMFWEIDYAMIDYTPETRVNTQKVSATSAIGSYAQDWTMALAKKDYNYMVQKSIGEITEIEYKVPAVDADQIQTAFLHTHGYYTLIREFEGEPKWEEIQKFETPGYFSEYSKTEYLNVLSAVKELSVASNN